VQVLLLYDSSVFWLSPIKHLVPANVVLGAVVAFYGVDWGTGSQSTTRWCLPASFPWALDLFLHWYCVFKVYLETYCTSHLRHCTLGNGFDLLLDVCKVEGLLGSHS
jgi:hypothetical protein